MSNCKLDVVREIERTLAGRLDQEQVTIVSEAVIKALANYDVTEMQTDIVPRESENERLLKQYCACLFVDGKSKHTIYQYRRACNRLAETIGKPFTEIGAYELRYFLACEKSRGVAASSVETYRAIFSAFFQWLANEEIIPKNPCANIKPGKINDAVRLPFSDVEIDALRSACETDKERALVELLLSSGIRVSEFSGLEISDIDPHKMTMSLTLQNGHDYHNQLMRLPLTIQRAVHPVRANCTHQKRTFVTTGLRILSKLVLLVLKTSLMGVRIITG